MKPTTHLLFLFLSLLMLNACKKEVVFEPDFPKKPGYVVFNLGDNTFQNYANQTIMLFGCNTALTNSSPDWHAMPDFQWKKSDQVLSKVPFGHKKYIYNKKKDTIHYHVNKYYVASPPLKALPNSTWGKKLDIGLVIPDQFTFDGANPVQEVYLDYTPLEPQYIYLIPLKFETSITDRKVKHVPFKVECSDLPWNPTNRIVNGEGASGIGAYQPGGTGFNSPNFFLPYTQKDGKEHFFNTEVTLLNDIMLRYEYKFRVPHMTKEGITHKEVTTIDVKEYFQSIEQFYDKAKDSITNTKMMVTIVAKERAKDDIPCGCQPPVVKDGPYGE